MTERDERTEGDRLGSPDLNRGSVVVRKDSLFDARIGPELVMMDPDQGLYFGMDPIGTTIWEQIDVPTSVAELCSHLLEAYDVEPATCERDVIEFLTTLWENGLVEIHPTSDR